MYLLPVQPPVLYKRTVWYRTVHVSGTLVRSRNSASTFPSSCANWSGRTACRTVSPSAKSSDIMLAPLTPAVTTTGMPRGRLILSIEGNIGIGKSTLLSNLKKRYAADPSVTFVDEPVAIWDEHDLLGAMYRNDISRCAFQLMALTTRYTALVEALRSEATVIITERSIHSDRFCFAQVNLESVPDKSAYDVTHDALLASLPSDLRHGAVFLAAPRTTLHERISRRARAAEQGAKDVNDDGEDGGDGGGIPDAYLAKLDAAHVAYMNTLNRNAKQAVDATATPEEVRISDAWSQPNSLVLICIPCACTGCGGCYCSN